MTENFVTILPHDKEHDQMIAHQIFEDVENNAHYDHATKTLVKKLQWLQENEYNAVF